MSSPIRHQQYRHRRRVLGLYRDLRLELMYNSPTGQAAHRVLAGQ